MESNNNVLDMDYLHRLVQQSENLSFLTFNQASSKSTVPFLPPKDIIEQEILNKASNDHIISRTCHFCKKVEETENNFIPCSNYQCNEAYCAECIEKINKLNGIEENFDTKDADRWECFKCRNICKCTRCKFGHKKKKKGKSRRKKYIKASIKTRGNNIIMIPFKSLMDDEHLYQNVDVDGFNILEINETNEDLLMDNNLIGNNKKIFPNRTCEEYFKDIYGEIDINVTCFVCSNDCFNTNEVLYFKDRKELINYLRYCFQFLKKKLFYDNTNYIDNKYDLDKVDRNFLKNWKFYQEKIICKSCFMKVVNMHNLIGCLKNIFSDPQRVELNSKPRTRKISQFLRTKRRKGNASNTNTNKKSHPKNDSRKFNENVIFDNVNNKLIIFKKALGDEANKDLNIRSSGSGSQDLANKTNEYDSDSNLPNGKSNEAKDNISSSSINYNNINNNTTSSQYNNNTFIFIKNLIPSRIYWYYTEIIQNFDNREQIFSKELSGDRYLAGIRMFFGTILLHFNKLLGTLYNNMSNIYLLQQYLSFQAMLTINTPQGEIIRRMRQEVDEILQDSLMLYNHNQNIYNKISLYKTMLEMKH